MSGLPRLEEPAFVLKPPRLVKIAAAAAMTTMGGTVLIWVTGFYGPEHPQALRYALGVFAVLFLAIASRPDTWRPLPIFAADRRGVYLVHRNGRDFTFVPWEDVGGMKVGWGEARVRNVLVEIRVADDQWKQLTGAGPNFSGPAPRSGFRTVNIGNACRDPEETLARIEAIRRAAGASGQGSPS